MAKSNPTPGRPTSLSVGAARAQLVRQALLAHPEHIERVEDIRRLPCLVRWAPTILDDALDRLVADGLITEAADGRLCVHRDTEPRR